MVYANTSAAVKARADWVVTSSIAVELIEHLDSLGKNYLGAGQTRELRAKTDRGRCTVLARGVYRA